jgi:hypothetical protein
MGKHLAFERIKPSKPKYCDYPLKGVLTERYELNQCTHQNLDRKDIPYLEGLRDGGFKEAQRLIDEIEKYDKIQIFLTE